MAETQAALFVNLDTTFTALRQRRAAVHPGDDLELAAGARTRRSEGFPQQRPFLRNSTALFRELKPGVAVLPDDARRSWPTRSRSAPGRSRRTPAFNERPRGRLRRARRTSPTDPLVPPGIQRLNDTVESLRPTLKFLTPAQTVCNYATLWFRNIVEPAVGGRQERHLAALHHHRDAAGPEQRGRPVERARPTAADRPGNYLHANPLPEHRRAGPDARVRGGQRGLQRRPDGRSATCRATRAPRPTARWRGRADARRATATRAHRRSRSARSS